MAGSRRITVEFLGKDTSLGKTASTASSKLRDAGKAADSSSKGFGRAGAGIGKLVGAFAGLAIGTKVVGFLKDSVGEAREAQKVGALTTQVIKTTGGAAKVTADQVGQLSAAISNKSGIDDEAIQSGANLLLTFKNIKNEAGKGNNIFDQTTQIMTDMGAAMGKEPKAAAIQLGKALNDPIKGVTALSKVGVTFDDKQKKVIKRLVETGDVAGAQKVILKELKSEFGGAAAASATAGDKAKVAWGNLKEQIGTQLLPVIDRLSKWFADKVVPAVSKFFTEMKTGEGTGGRVAEILQKVGDVLGTIFGFLSRHHETVLTFVGVLGAMSVAFGILNAVMMANPISIIIVAIAALVTGLIMAYKKSETFREIVNGAFEAIGGVAKTMWYGILQPIFKFLVKTFVWVADKIVSAAAWAFGWVPGIGPKLKTAAAKMKQFKEDVNNQLDGVKPVKIKIDKAEARRDLNDFIDWIGGKTAYVKVQPKNNLGDLLSPNRATGGSVHAGRAYTVGENGRETFIPTGNGRIVPNRRTDRGGTTIVVNIHGVTDKKGAAREIRAALLDLKRSNGGAVLGIA